MINAVVHDINDMTELSTTFLELIFESDRILLLKIVNLYMENINKILEKNNWNITRSLGDGHCPPIQRLDIQHIFSISLLIVTPFTITISMVYYFVLSTCLSSLLLYFCEYP